MLEAPFPYWGTKKTVAHIVWQALGTNIKHYIEPFFGSGAVLLQRPEIVHTENFETVNDADGNICNVWRAMQSDPENLAKFCDWPSNHADLTARRRVLSASEKELLKKLVNDETYCDVKLAGYWIWAASQWIGSDMLGNSAKRQNITDGGMGVHRLLKHVNEPNMDADVTDPYNINIYAWFRALSERLRYVRVVCGDWSQLCSGNWQDNKGIGGMFFDPPYGIKADRTDKLYTTDSLTVADEVRKWSIIHGDKPTLRIVLAGYYEEHKELLEFGWTVYNWKAQSGYSNLGNGIGKTNRDKEALFMSPYCLSIEEDKSNKKDFKSLSITGKI